MHDTKLKSSPDCKVFKKRICKLAKQNSMFIVITAKKYKLQLKCKPSEKEDE